MDSDKNMIYQIIFFSILTQVIIFVWYYLTLPTIKTNSKTAKHSITSALIKFLIFMLPFYIFMAYNIYLFKQHEIGLLCKNLPAIINYGEKMCFSAKV